MGFLHPEVEPHMGDIMVSETMADLDKVKGWVQYIRTREDLDKVKGYNRTMEDLDKIKQLDPGSLDKIK